MSSLSTSSSVSEVTPGARDEAIRTASDIPEVTRSLNTSLGAKRGSRRSAFLNENRLVQAVSVLGILSVVGFAMSGPEEITV